MKKVFAVCLFGLISGVLHCQSAGDAGSTVTFYYNSKYELTTPEKSFFKRIAQFNLYDMVFEGVYKDYDLAGRLIGDGYYDHGKLTGFQSEYDETGATKSSVEYNGKDFTIWQLADGEKGLSVARGTGMFTIPYYYFFDWKLKHGTLTGEFRNGERSGTWVYSDATNQITDKEVYARGRLLSHVYFKGEDSIAVPHKKEIILSVRTFLAELLSFDRSSFGGLNQCIESQVQYPADFQRPVTYAGGLKKLLLLLGQQATIPDKNLVLVKLKINEHGMILKSTIVRSVNDETDVRVLNAIENHRPYFLPAIKGGKPYATTVYLPVAGGDEWTDMISHMPTEWFLDPNNFY